MIMTSNCQYCGRSNEQEIEDGVPFWITEKLAKLYTCDVCAYARARDAEAQAKDRLTAARREKWISICPEVYRTYDSSLCGNPAMSDRIANWESIGGMGLIVIGPSRSGKTRAVYRMLERKFMEGRRLVFARGTQWTNWAVDASRGDRPARDKIEAAHNADITVIDDFAKTAWTERVEGEFWDLMEVRGSNARPTVLTCTETGDTLASRMGQNSVDILRRIKEFCEPIIWR